MKTIAIICRAYGGDENRLKSSLLQTLSMFVDVERYEIIFVLDDENELDHAVGERLKPFGKVFYEAVPSDNVLQTRPFRSLGGRYGSAGYTRQLYSTFFFDNYTSADIIGVVDADNEFHSFLTLQTVLDSTGKIFLPAINGDHYPSDSAILNESVPFDFMGTDVMPKIFYRSTFKALRETIVRRSGLSTFNEAFNKYAIDFLSPVNVLSYYGLVYEPTLYKLILPTDSVGMFTTASNRPNGLWELGCCRSFRLPCGNLRIGYESIYFSNAVYDKSWGKAPIWLSNAKYLAKEHYGNVHEILLSMNQSRVKMMNESCVQGLLRLSSDASKNHLTDLFARTLYSTGIFSYLRCF